ncbi:nucleotide-diphospho-sugar transferase [Vararia minispora EC-137]|uniref:Nucleotide-diphospho-sugar transferase n=1 Tax=Vararia minispora EC-137 TaxID=1314806 RepID=A0ACB8QH22_9AGAM|nr:nucleotide-diphospho-sugar transferase [Vararia minispora EC-137]
MALDFDPAPPNLQSREFLAVVLAGHGNQLSPLTNDNGDEPCPKALLPIANLPLIDYPLAWLELSGITDVLLVCPARHRAALSHHITSSTSYPSLAVDIHAYDDADADLGTAGVLRSLAPRIRRDFVLLPCDLIPPADLPLVRVLDTFRLGDALLASCWISRRADLAGAAPDEWGARAQKTPIVWDKLSASLLHVDAPDVGEPTEEFELRMGLVTKYPRTTLSSEYTDTHVYVCKRAVLELLLLKPSFESFRDEFVPWLCKLQYQRTKQAKYAHVLHTPADPDPALALRHATLGPLTAAGTGLSTDDTPSPSTRGTLLSAPPSPTRPTARATLPPMRVALLAHATGAFATRFLSSASWTLPTEPKDRALIDPRAQIAPDALVGASTRIAERTVVKRSVVGRHCILGRGARVLGCVLGDHVVIEEGAKLDGCILGAGTKVGAKAELVRCVTQAGYEVDAGETVRHEKLEISDWAAAGDSDDDDDDDADDDDDEDEESEEN